MARFDPTAFPKYDLLTPAEKLFLRTCCYYPPKPRREVKPSDFADIEPYRETYTKAFPGIWKKVRGKRVLGLGCGEGGFVLALAEGGAGEAVGIDIHDDFELARAAAAERGLSNARFRVADVADVEGESFDVVISHDSFEHFERPGHILHEMARVTKPGGRLLIKFGPPWRNPWGRHMSGTVRRDRPWVHLVVPESVVAHCHSVYHDHEEMNHTYADRRGGLNKMTLGRFAKLLRDEPLVEVVSTSIIPLYGINVVRMLPRALQEFVASGVRAECRRLGR